MLLLLIHIKAKSIARERAPTGAGPCSSRLQLPAHLVGVARAGVHQGQLRQEPPAFQSCRQTRMRVLVAQRMQRALPAFEPTELGTFAQRAPAPAMADDAEQPEGRGVHILREHGITPWVVSGTGDGI